MLTRLDLFGSHVSDAVGRPPVLIRTVGDHDANALVLVSAERRWRMFRCYVGRSHGSECTRPFALNDLLSERVLLRLRQGAEHLSQLHGELRQLELSGCR